MEIDLINYTEEWKNDFESERNFLINLFGEQIVVVEHVGSTAIPMKLSKPVVDIFVGADPLRDREYYSSRLDNMKYRFLATGMTNRLLFQKYVNERWTHNIHILKYTDQFQHRNEILFRDFIKDKKELMQEYAALKMKLKQETTNLEDYTKGKTAFIQKVVDQARKEKGFPPVSVWE